MRGTNNGPLFNPVIRPPAHTSDPPAAKEAAAKQDTTKRAKAALEAVRALIEAWGESPTACEVGREMYGDTSDPVERYKRTENARRALSDCLVAKPMPLLKHDGRRVGRVDGKDTTSWDLVER